MPRWLSCIVLLVASNAFMNTAWYYHLKKSGWSMLVAIGISWLIALPEYCLQVPGNRLGSDEFGGPFSPAQLKVLQEAITMIVFVVFSMLVLGRTPKVWDYAAMVLIFAGVAVSQLGPRVFGSVGS
jgi:uncharacterized protein (DUF486 family)